MGTYGPSYDANLDHDRIANQMERITGLMLVASEANKWLTLGEIETHLKTMFPNVQFPQASISAQLRHLRKDAFGAYLVRKRRREPAYRGIWEYSVRKRPIQTKFNFGE